VKGSREDAKGEEIAFSLSESWRLCVLSEAGVSLFPGELQSSHAKTQRRKGEKRYWNSPLSEPLRLSVLSEAGVSLFPGELQSSHAKTQRRKDAKTQRGKGGKRYWNSPLSEPLRLGVLSEAGVRLFPGELKSSHAKTQRRKGGRDIGASPLRTFASWRLERSGREALSKGAAEFSRKDAKEERDWNSPLSESLRLSVLSEAGVRLFGISGQLSTLRLIACSNSKRLSLASSGAEERALRTSVAASFGLPRSM